MGTLIYDKDLFRISLNNNGSDVGAPDDQIYVRADANKYFYTPEQARGLAEALNDAAVALEDVQQAYKAAHKPKLPTGIGAVIETPMGHRLIRVNKDTWRTISNVFNYTEESVRNDFKDFTVLSEGVEL